jgi:hypothetical protein
LAFASFAALEFILDVSGKFQMRIHTTVAVQWHLWFMPHEANLKLHEVDGFLASTWPSICSTLVAILEALRALLNNAAQNEMTEVVTIC